jgi:hypothetical protein
LYLANEIENPVELFLRDLAHFSSLFYTPIFAEYKLDIFMNFKQWLETGSVFHQLEKLAMAWTQLPLQRIKQELQTAINILGQTGQDNNPDVFHLAGIMQDLIPQLQQSPHARALDTELAQLEALIGEYI